MRIAFLSISLVLLPQLAPWARGDDRAVEKSLSLVAADVEYDGARLAKVLADLQDAAGTRIWVNWEALEPDGITPDSPVSLHLQNVRLSEVLDVLLDATPNHPRRGWQVEEGVIVVSTDEDLAEFAEPVVYGVADLLAVIRQRGGDDWPDLAAVLDLHAVITKFVAPLTWIDNGGNIGQIEWDEDRPVIATSRAVHAELRQLLVELRATMP